MTWPVTWAARSLAASRWRAEAGDGLTANHAATKLHPSKTEIFGDWGGPDPSVVPFRYTL